MGIHKIFLTKDIHIILNRKIIRYLFPILGKFMRIINFPFIFTTRKHTSLSFNIRIYYPLLTKFWLVEFLLTFSEQEQRWKYFFAFFFRGNRKKKLKNFSLNFIMDTNEFFVNRRRERGEVKEKTCDVKEEKLCAWRHKLFVV